MDIVTEDSARYREWVQQNDYDANVTVLGCSRPLDRTVTCKSIYPSITEGDNDLID